ncbi:MAG: phosphate acyltransferase PlsX [Lachnospiraceae bacterium]|nr:phosphate acyltransferase PlsX [Lachnospiraceae bacterium]
MSDYITVAIDGMGGDNGALEMVKGAVNAVNEHDNVKVIICGDEETINTELAKYEYADYKIEVVPTTEEVEVDASPVMEIRQKKDSSMVVAMKLVKEGRASGFVSAGSSGAILVGGQLLVGRMKGVQRAPLAPLVPNTEGISLLIDAGANMDAKPEHLVQYAQMGSIYMEKIVGIKNPRVGIVNVGVEEHKGNKLVKETFPLLKELDDINFIGSVEPRDVPHGACDVIVCDAFVGNALLKVQEGLASALVHMIKDSIMKSTRTKIGGALVKPAIKDVMKLFDTSEYGGAPLLGLDGLVVKIHGNATHKEMKNAILQCVDFTEKKVNDQIRESIQKTVNKDK